MEYSTREYYQCIVFKTYRSRCFCDIPCTKFEVTPGPCARFSSDEIIDSNSIIVVSMPVIVIILFILAEKKLTVVSIQHLSEQAVIGIYESLLDFGAPQLFFKYLANINIIRHGLIELIHPKILTAFKSSILYLCVGVLCVGHTGFHKWHNPKYLFVYDFIEILRQPIFYDYVGTGIFVYCYFHIGKFWCGRQGLNLQRRRLCLCPIPSIAFPTNRRSAKFHSRPHLKYSVVIIIRQP